MINEDAINGILKIIDRFEIIDENGRVYVRGSKYKNGYSPDPVDVKISIQDDGKTLKVFVTPQR